ncbi:MAG: hypothetical protein HC767_12285, partial [Akkermansiaceae bacterium]|nr:hypothetical protein [Akkermansiaceae bacterium]
MARSPRPSSPCFRHRAMVVCRIIVTPPRIADQLDIAVTAIIDYFHIAVALPSGLGREAWWSIKLDRKFFRVLDRQAGVGKGDITVGTNLTASAFSEPTRRTSLSLSPLQLKPDPSNIAYLLLPLSCVSSGGNLQFPRRRRAPVLRRCPNLHPQTGY